MPVRLLVDECVSIELTNRLRALGHQVSVQSAGSDDEAILRWASNSNYVVITTDWDFLSLHDRGEGHNGIVHCPLQVDSWIVIAAAISDLLIRAHGNLGRRAFRKHADCRMVERVANRRSVRTRKKR